MPIQITTEDNILLLSDRLLCTKNEPITFNFRHRSRILQPAHAERLLDRLALVDASARELPHDLIWRIAVFSLNQYLVFCINCNDQN